MISAAKDPELGPSSRAIEAALERVAASNTFRSAERSRVLLRFIVEQTLTGRADRLKDYTLGAEALGRGDDFDPRVDPTARVEASRLRSRLDVYYATEGADDEVRISLPKGGYVPRYETRSVATPRSDAPAPVASQPERTWRRATLGAVVTVGVVTLAWWGWRSSRSPRADVTWLEVTTPSTTDPASLAISPDGRSLVFVASVDGVTGLWLRSLATGASHALAHTDYAALPFWSPDGHAVGFFADGAIKAVDLQTGLVGTLATAPVPSGAAWSTQGVVLYALVPDSPLFQRPISGGPATPVTRLAPGQTGHRGPVFLPDGRRFLFLAEGAAPVRGIHLGQLGSTVTHRLFDADSPAIFVAPDVLLFIRGSTLLAQRVDPASLARVGEPATLADGISPDPRSSLAPVTASLTGTIAFRTGETQGLRQFVWFDRRGRELSRVGTPDAQGPSYASMSPDRRRLAVQRSKDGNTDIWILDLERATAARLTTDPRPDIAPVWSPGGDRIAYASQVDGVFQLFEQPVSGGTAKVIATSPDAKQVTDWSRDGRYVLFRSVATMPTPDMDIWAIPLDGNRAPVPVIRTPFEERDAQLSPDGKWIAYESNDSGRAEVYVQPFLRTGERVRISSDGGAQVRWRADGRELFFLTLDGRLVAVPVIAGTNNGRFQSGSPTPLFHAPVGAVQGVALPAYIPADDGERFLLDTMLEVRPAPISIVLNWRLPTARRAVAPLTQ